MADSTINDDDDSTLQCPICLEPFQSRTYLSPCLHSFCASCLSQWLDLTLACPMCKARPKQLHADVDTTLGTVTTIPIPGPSSPSTPEPRTPFSSSSTGQVPLREQSSWKVLLKQLATKGTAVSSSSSPNQTSLQGQQTRKRSRSRSCSPSSRSDTSRSRSVTPIDSYHHQYVPESLTNASNTILFEETLVASSSESHDPRPTSVTRRQVYVFGLEPIPSQDYTLADRLDPIRDGPLVTPFLKRDLAVLTNVDPETADPIVVAHVSSVLFNSATGTTLGSVSTSSSSSSSSSAATSTSRQQPPMPKNPRRAKETETVVSPNVWDMVAQEISQWIMLDSATGETSLGMAQQFVREMRRVAVRRWKMGEWDKHVKYSKIPSSSSLSPSLPNSIRIDPTP